jgi:hypothetical protein
MRAHNLTIFRHDITGLVCSMPAYSSMKSQERPRQTNLRDLLFRSREVGGSRSANPGLVNSPRKERLRKLLLCHTKQK